MGCSIAEHYMIVLPPDSNQPGEQQLQWTDNRFNIHEDLSQLSASIRSLLVENQSGDALDCRYCGRMGKLPPCEIRFGVEGNNSSGYEEDLLQLAGPLAQERGAPLRVTVQLAKHFANSISLCDVYIHIWVLGGPSEQAVLHAIIVGSGIERIRFDSSIPLPLLEFLPLFRILALQGANINDEYPVDSEGESESKMADGGKELSLSTLSDFPGFVSAVSTSSKLEILDITKYSFEGLPFDQFFDALFQSQSLVDLSIEECNFITKLTTDGYGLQALTLREEPAANKSYLPLTDLRIKDCVLDTKAMDCLGRLLSCTNNLQRLAFVKIISPTEAPAAIDQASVGGIGGLIEAIVALLDTEDCHLKKLTLSKYSGSIDVTALANVLQTNAGLVELDLSENELIRMGTLTHVLQTNQALHILNISRSTIMDKDDSKDKGVSEDPRAIPSIDSFYTGLATSRGLRTLNMSNLQLSNDSMEQLSGSMGLNKSLHTLLLNYLTVVAPMFVKNNPIPDFDPAFNPPTHSTKAVSETPSEIAGYQSRTFRGTFVPLFESLRTNAVLQRLEIGGNKIEKDDISVLVELLVSNTTLEYLSISGCGLTDHLVAAFAARLPDMKGLCALDLSRNKFGKDGATALLKGLQNNHSISKVDVHNSCWSIGGPVHYICKGYEEENKKMQLLVKRNCTVGGATSF